MEDFNCSLDHSYLAEIEWVYIDIRYNGSYAVT